MGYVPLGQCNINLTGFVKNTGFISQDDQVAVCQSFDMSINKLENVRILPKKNYETNTLECGFLQLANGTNFIVNEDALSAGQINEVGLRSLQAIQQLLAAQTVAYDFTYHTSQMEVDIPVMVLSEGKSFFLSFFLINNVISPLFPSKQAKVLNPPHLNPLATFPFSNSVCLSHSPNTCCQLNIPSAKACKDPLFIDGLYWLACSL